MRGHRRRRRIAWLLVAALAWSAAPGIEAEAGKKGKAPELAAGGRTIAGPGTLTLDAGADRTVWSWGAQAGLWVCVTVANARGRVSYTVEGTNQPVTGSLDAGEEACLCEVVRKSLRIRCDEGPCATSWRVDQW